MNAKFVDFCGWALPHQFGKENISQSVMHTRRSASLFDVSHMYQTIIRGEGRVSFAERLLTANIGKLRHNRATYTLMTNEDGGIIDDCVISNHGDSLYLVTNGGTEDKVRDHIAANMRSNVDVLHLQNKALVALQGPLAHHALARHIEPQGALDDLYFMEGKRLMVCGYPCVITRCGYTGEDGFELSIDAEHANSVVESLVAEPEVKLAGLIARDILRLEAGLCLYGTDIDDSTTPVKASLNFAVPKSRRKTADFIGAERIINEFAIPPLNKRVGLIVKGAPPIHGASVMTNDFIPIGKITSGAMSLTIKSAVAMAYVDMKYASLGTELMVQHRMKRYPAIVSAMPFVSNGYCRRPNGRRI
jgi:aminomethyltransferase